MPPRPVPRRLPLPNPCLHRGPSLPAPAHDGFMQERKTPTSGGWFTGRTRLITVVSIIAVGVAGASAVSANIGILDTASQSAVGSAAATDDLVSSSVVTLTVPPASTTSASAATTTAAGDVQNDVQQFVVDVAGTVSVAASGATLTLDDVAPAAGWTWRLTQNDPGAMLVTFTNGTRTFEFLAALTPDGSIAANVSEPIVTPAPTAAPAAGPSGTTGAPTDDDSRESDDSGDDSRVDDSDESHDGERDGEDDDDEEYEGGEDDD